MEIESIKIELKNTREEKFNYQAKVIELRKALKSKLGELEVSIVFDISSSFLNFEFLILQKSSNNHELFIEIFFWFWNKVFNLYVCGGGGGWGTVMPPLLL